MRGIFDFLKIFCYATQDLFPFLKKGIFNP
jgi:hypothetical protein